VVTLCAESELACPAFPAGVAVEHWSLPDPSAAQSSDADKLEVFRRVRDEIEVRVRALVGRLSTIRPEKSIT
jgi:arsenate reductase